MHNTFYYAIRSANSEFHLLGLAKLLVFKPVNLTVRYAVVNRTCRCVCGCRHCRKWFKSSIIVVVGYSDVRLKLAVNTWLHELHVWSSHCSLYCTVWCTFRELRISDFFVILYENIVLHTTTLVLMCMMYRKCCFNSLYCVTVELAGDNNFVLYVFLIYWCNRWLNIFVRYALYDNRMLLHI